MTIQPSSLVERYAHKLKVLILDPTTCSRLKAKYVQEARMIYMRSSLPIPEWVHNKEQKATGEIADKLRLFGVEEKDINILLSVADDYMIKRIKKLNLRDLMAVKTLSYEQFCSDYLGFNP